MESSTSSPKKTVQFSPLPPGNIPLAAQVSLPALRNRRHSQLVPIALERDYDEPCSAALSTAFFPPTPHPVASDYYRSDAADDDDDGESSTPTQERFNKNNETAVRKVLGTPSADTLNSKPQVSAAGRRTVGGAENSTVAMPVGEIARNTAENINARPHTGAAGVGRRRRPMSPRIVVGEQGSPGIVAEEDDLTVIRWSEGEDSIGYGTEEEEGAEVYGQRLPLSSSSRGGTPDSREGTPFSREPSPFSREPSPYSETTEVPSEAYLGTPDPEDTKDFSNDWAVIPRTDPLWRPPSRSGLRRSCRLSDIYLPLHTEATQTEAIYSFLTSTNSRKFFLLLPLLLFPLFYPASCLFSPLCSSHAASRISTTAALITSTTRLTSSIIALKSASKAHLTPLPATLSLVHTSLHTEATLQSSLARTPTEISGADALGILAQDAASAVKLVTALRRRLDRALHQLSRLLRRFAGFLILQNPGGVMAAVDPPRGWDAHVPMPASILRERGLRRNFDGLLERAAAVVDGVSGEVEAARAAVDGVLDALDAATDRGRRFDGVWKSVGVGMGAVKTGIGEFRDALRTVQEEIVVAGALARRRNIDGAGKEEVRRAFWEFWGRLDELEDGSIIGLKGRRKERDELVGEKVGEPWDMVGEGIPERKNVVVEKEWKEKDADELEWGGMQVFG